MYASLLQGDHIYTDAALAKMRLNWRTALVLAELELEIEALARGRAHRQQLKVGADDGLGFVQAGDQGKPSRKARLRHVCRAESLSCLSWLACIRHGHGTLGSQSEPPTLH
jgi:hypothetical protein